MIKLYKDHAANERTYLAWIRTAIVIMAFGFLVEKFDLFISYIGHVMGSSVYFRSSIFVEYIGLGLMLVAVAVIIGSTIRFFHIERAIKSKKLLTYSAKWPNIILASLMIILASVLIFYMAFQLLRF